VPAGLVGVRYAVNGGRIDRLATAADGSPTSASRA
jgi:hypothetical protein